MSHHLDTPLAAQPGFHPEARYELTVHFDGADFEDLTYRVTFPAGPGIRRRQRPRTAGSSAAWLAASRHTPHTPTERSSC